MESPEKALRSRRGRSNRQKGLAFERRISAKIRAAGLGCRRAIETDGFSVGADLIVFEVLRPFSSDHPEVRFTLPVAVQCKFTQDPSDEQRGLVQARAGQPTARFWACIWKHSSARQPAACTWVFADCDKRAYHGTLDALIAELLKFKQVK